MERDHRGIKQEVDLGPSPDERAQRVLDVIKKASEDITDWDLTCFSSQWLAAMAIGPMPWLLEEAKRISGMVYRHHFLLGAERHDVKSSSI